MAVLVGDDAADALMAFARFVAREGGAEIAALRVINPEGNTVEASFLLNGGTAIMVETADAPLEEPDNGDTVARLRAKIAARDRGAVFEMPNLSADLL